MKKIGFIITLSMVMPFLVGCNGESYNYIKLISDDCELRKTPDSKGTNSIQFKKGSSNLSFYIYPTKDPSKNIYINYITTGKEDFTNHYEQPEDYHFVTDNTILNDDLIINAEATNLLTVTFHANDGLYSDGTTTRKIKDVRVGETFGEVVKRLKEKPIRSMMDSLEGWTDFNKISIHDGFVIEDNLTVFADYHAYSCYALFNNLNESIDQSNMQKYGEYTYILFDPNENFKFTFLFKDGYKLNQNGLTVVDETVPQREVIHRVEDNSLLIYKDDIADHNLIIDVPNVSLVEYEVNKPSYDYLTIDDAGYENPTIESGYKATLTFKDGYKIPSRDMVAVTVGGEVYKDFVWEVNEDKTISFEIPSGVIGGDLSYNVSSYKLEVSGSVINALSPSTKVSGMSVTLTSNEERFPYVATTTTDEYGCYTFAYIEDVSYSISIDLTTGITPPDQWVSNQDTLTITPEEIKEGIKKDFYVAKYSGLTTQSLKLKINTNYSHYNISAYNGLANAQFNSGDSSYTIDLKKEYNPNLLLNCTYRKTGSHSLGILDMPTTVVPVDMATVESELDLSINAYKNYGETSDTNPTMVCRNIKGGSYGCYLATSRNNNNFAFMIHCPSLRDGSIYRIAFTIDNAAKVLDNRTFIISFTTLGKILSITDGNGNSVDNPELIHIYSHEPEGSGSAAVEIATTTDFIKAQGIMMTDDQNIYCTLQSERLGYYGEFVSCVLDNPSTYRVLKANGSF